MPGEKLANSQSHLHRVDPRVRRCEPRIRNMHVTQFKAHVSLRAQNVHTQSGLVHEIHRVRSGRNVVIREQDSASEFQIRRNAAVALEIPFQSKRIKTYSICRVGRLKSKKYWNGIDRIFKPAAKETG